jgi:DNA polymerase-1
MQEKIKVNHKNFVNCVEEILLEEVIACDTETTGLLAYSGAKIFSVIFTTKTKSYYFNFDSTPDHNGDLAPIENILPWSWIDDFQKIFNQENKIIFFHNAKFDLHFLNKEGLEFNCRVLCTEMLSRIVNNRLNSYSLANMGELIGFQKDDTVEKYISKHKLYTLVDVGKKKPRKDKHFNLVPFDIISNYGMQDGIVTYELGNYCLARIKELDDEQVILGLPTIYRVLKIEEKLTKALFRMEKRGALVDVPYIQKAYAYENDQRDEAGGKFEAVTGEPFEDAAKCFKKVFQKLGLKAGRTPKGNDSYSADNLPDNFVSELILTWRKHNKRSGTYWKNFLDLKDDNNIIHTSFKQSGTKTGRLSCENPNLQNVPKRGEDRAEYPVRKAFIPREGFFFAMVDWDQMEYRLLLDLAGEAEVIKDILENNLDVHTATANAMEVVRDYAKTLNFMLLYGGGAAKLAAAINVTIQKAKELKVNYFRKLQRVKALTEALVETSKNRGFIVNAFGRRILLDEAAPYRMPNHYIQGGCGDAAKAAIVEIDKLLLDYETSLILTVHDEVILEVKYGEEFLIPQIKDIMENVYKPQALPLTAGVDFSLTDWHNKGAYNGETFNAS